MTLQLPIKEWWTAQDIADAGLPDLSSSMQGVADHAKKYGWRGHPEFARRRDKRGGGWEYHWRLFPARAQRELIERSNPPEEPKVRQDRGEVWTWFDALPDSVKDKAKRSLRIIQEVEALAPATTKFLAVDLIAKAHHVSDRTIWNWFERVEGVDEADRLPYLAPRHRATPPKGQKCTAAPEFYTFIKTNFLRPEGLGFSAVWRDAKRLCEGLGLEFLTERTARRWLDTAVPILDQIFAREGMKGLQQRFPPQIRDRSQMTAMEMVNADCHKIDVFVWWPGFDKPIRPQLIVFQDIYSGRILSWAIDINPNKVAVMQAFMTMIKDFGLPRHCLFDNGMEFANKQITGAAKRRFRFPIAEHEPMGVLAMLGIDVTFATPGHGQAKPIERAFRDFASDMAKDIRFAGAYVGNHIDNKPENYMSRAVDLDDFIRVVEERIHEHNTREGRRSHTAQGRSLDQTFRDSYERTPMRPATEEQLRLCLMAQYVCDMHKKNGQITLYKNHYWSEWMSELAGQKITARFNPEDLHEGAHIYSMEGEFLGFAACRQKSAFRDISSAKAAAREAKRRRKHYQAQLKDHLQLSQADLAAALNAAPLRAPSLPEAAVVQLARQAELEKRKRGGGLIHRLPLPEVTETAAQAAAHSALILEFQQKDEDVRVPASVEPPISLPPMAVKPVEQPETDVDRFHRWLAVEARHAAGEQVGEIELRHLRQYQSTPEYRRMMIMKNDFQSFGSA